MNLINQWITRFEALKLLITHSVTMSYFKRAPSFLICTLSCLLPAIRALNVCDL